MSKGWKNNFVKVKGEQVKNKQRRGEKVTQLSPYLHRLTFQNIFSPGLSPYLQRLTLQSIFSPGFVEAPLYKMPKWWNMRTACIFILCIWGGHQFSSNQMKYEQQIRMLLTRYLHGAGWHCPDSLLAFLFCRTYSSADVWIRRDMSTEATQVSLRSVRNLCFSSRYFNWRIKLSSIHSKQNYGQKLQIFQLQNKDDFQGTDRGRTWIWECFQKDQWFVPQERKAERRGGGQRVRQVQVESILAHTCKITISQFQT